MPENGNGSEKRSSVPEEVSPSVKKSNTIKSNNFVVKSPGKNSVNSEKRNSDLASKFLGFFSAFNKDDNKQRTFSIEPPLNNDEPNEIEDSSTNSNNGFETIDEETKQCCIEMLKYYRPSSSSKSDPKLEKWLPPFIELDSPIPEELSLDYEIAKHDILGSIALPDKTPEEHKQVLVKYNALSSFMFIKSDVYRNMNDRLICLLEVNLFPVVLEATIMHKSNPTKYKEFMISINGKKRKAFLRSTVRDKFAIFKTRLLLGWLDNEAQFIIPE